MPADKTLSPNQIKAIDLLALEGMSAREVAKTLELHENTLYGWLRSRAYPHFQAAYQTRLDDAVEFGRRKLQAAVGQATDQVIEIAFGSYNSSQVGLANIRLKACESILDRVGVVKGSKTSVSFDGLSDEELIRRAAGTLGGDGAPGVDALPSALPAVAEPVAEDR